MKYDLRFFHYVKDRSKIGQCLVSLQSSDIPQKGAKIYLGNDKLLNGPDHLFTVKRVVRCYSGDDRDLARNDGDALVSVEIEIVKYINA